jgi:hypothetical protein
MATLKEDDDNLDIVELPERKSGDTLTDDKPQADKRLSDSDDDEDDHSDGGSTGDPERDALRERRRLEKLERKQRREAAIKRDKIELDFLRKQNDTLERRMAAQEQRAAQTDVGNYAAQAQQARQEAETAERVIAKAVEAGNGDDVAKAMRYRDEAIARANQLTYAQQQAQQNAQRIAQTPRPPAPADQRVLELANDFLTTHKEWYDPQGRNEESAIVLAIDQGLVRDGYDPASEDYWDELKNRAARRLPERFGKAAQKTDREARGGPAVGSGREHAPQSTRKEIHISPERKQALIEAGVWDDPVLRMKYAKRYAEYDRAQSNRA